jgi:multiple sugar transport system ATP-binding protein
MTLGQRVALLRDGVLQQVDTPQRLFHEPANLFVAAFIGSPSMNLIEADIVDGNIRFAGYELPLPREAHVAPRRVIVGIRPTDFKDGGSADPTLPRLRVHATVVEDLGAESYIIFTLDAPRVVAEAVRAAADTAAPDESLLAYDTRAVFTARLDGERGVAQGEEVDLALDPRRMYLFDPATGDVLSRRR